MKYLIPVLLFWSFNSIAQISITSSQFPTTGDTMRMSVAQLDQSIDYQTTGPNQNWDFSALVLDSQRVNDYRPVTETSSFSQLYFGAFAPSSYRASYYTKALDFPITSAMSGLPISIDNIIQFTKLNADSLTNVGFAVTFSGTEVPVKSDTIEKVYDFPLNFQDSWTSHGFTALDMNPLYDIKFKQHRYRVSQVDGWGTINTPFGSFDALRIHHTIYETDSIYIAFDTLPGTWTVIPVPTQNQYEWLSNTEKDPILRISTSDLQGFETVTNITYRDFYHDPPLALNALKEDGFSIFPNPVQDHLYITSPVKIERVQLFSCEGKLIRSEVLNAQTGMISTQDLEPGVYQLVLESQGSKMSSSFFKI